MEIIAIQSTSFANTAVDYQNFENQLRQARFGPLSSQEGRTADDLRETFQRGEKHSREIAEKNGSKASTYSFVRDSMNELRSALTSIAQTGNSKIKEIQDSTDPIPVKIGKITDVALSLQGQASTKAAMYGDNIINAVQKILDREGISLSARQFAKDHNVDTDHAFQSPNKDAVRDQVQRLVENVKSETHPTSRSDPLEKFQPFGGSTLPTGGPPGLADSADVPAPSARPGRLDAPAPQIELAAPAGASARPGRLDIPPQIGSAAPLAQTNATAPARPGFLDTIAFAGSPGTTPPVSGIPQVPLAGTTTPYASPPSLPSLPAASSPASMAPAGLPPGVTPSGLTQGFDHGMQTGTPMASATNMLSSGPMAAIESQLPPAPEPSHAQVMSTIPPSSHVPVYDVPTQGAAATTEVPQAQSHAPITEATTTYVAAPSVPAAPTPVGPAPTNSLPAYGTDIRPPTSTISVSTAPTSVHPGPPTSAPVNPSSAGGGIHQPTVVRRSAQPAPAASAPQTPSGIVERAVASSTSGAVAGAVSANATARNRLQRLIDAVARQEPRLRWAAGDRCDGTTVLVTDLASGWIPPHIDIPVGMCLREPACRRGGVEVLLGEVTVTAGYTPVPHLSPTGDTDLVPISPQARHVPAIEELGWELNQATNWRDGLPRLARTLAIAASRGTGVLDSEIELLRTEIGQLREQVLTSYPDAVEATAVRNWQLLAAIDALANGDNMGANYHFSWFQALNQAQASRPVS